MFKLALKEDNYGTPDVLWMVSIDLNSIPLKIRQDSKSVLFTI